MRGEYKIPEGLIYYPNFISIEEEKKLLAFIQTLEFHKIVIFEQEAKRTVAHFGYKYNYEKASLTKGNPFPPILKELSNKCADLANIPHEKIVQCLISYYPVGATIGWHRDKFIFGPKVIGVSLLSNCLMRFQLKKNEKRFVYEQELASCSAYILSGKARFNWDHSIPAVKKDRYSITFRTCSKSSIG
jgi:alkylated DNA repair protein (DNA oxidative demethylase)